MGLWDNPKRGEPPTLPDLSAVTPEEFKRAWKARLVTHCEHGRPRTQHCPWCYVQTPAYRQSLAEAMWTILD